MLKMLIPESLQQIEIAMNHHIGSGDDAHMPANYAHNGFMAIQDKKDLHEAKGYRTQIQAGTDIYTLKPGHYWGVNLVNSSIKDPKDGSVITIDVTKINDNYIQFKEVYSFNSQVYYHVKHVNSAGANTGAPVGWSRSEQVYPLWSGVASTPGVVLQLTDDSKKFRKLKITVDNQNSSVETYEMTLVPSVAVESHNAYNTEPGFGIYEITLGFSGYQATIKSNNSYVLSNGNMIPNPEKATILKIEGVL